jgi:hypothetical protein
VILLVYSLDQNYNLSTRPPDQFIIIQDVLYRPWLLPSKFQHLEPYDWVAVGLAIATFSLAAIEVAVYYLTQPFPFSNEQLAEEPPTYRKVM